MTAQDFSDKHRDAVRLTALVADRDGESRFVDERLPYSGSSGPLRVTQTAPAQSLAFHWMPGNFNRDFHPAPRRGLFLVIGGALEITASSGEARVFRLADLLDVRDLSGRGHRGKPVGGQPVRFAFIAFDDAISGDPRDPLDGAPPAAAGPGIDYAHNREDATGRSYTAPAHLPYLFGGPNGVATPALPLSGFRFSHAADNFDYAWHPAPRRQAVLVLSGGIVMTLGSGQQTTVSTGGFLIGEDTDGKGHISRAEGGKPRFSVFAHLA